MPNLNIHCALSSQRTGFDFKELHKWMDDPSKTLGVDHRMMRHSLNRQDWKTIEAYWEKRGLELNMGYGWGKKAVIEWLFHIALDNISTAFKVSQKVYGDKTYNSLLLSLHKSGFINAAFKTVPDEELERMIPIGVPVEKEICTYCGLPGSPFHGEMWCPLCGRGLGFTA